MGSGEGSTAGSEPWQNDAETSRYKLTWLKNRRAWRKRHKGKDYYFPIEDHETKEGSYKRCLSEWQQIREGKEQDTYAPHEALWRSVLGTLDLLLGDAQEQNRHSEWIRVKQWITHIEHKIARKERFDLVQFIKFTQSGFDVKLMPADQLNRPDGFQPATSEMVPPQDPEMLAELHKPPQEMPAPWDLISDTKKPQTIKAAADEYIAHRKAVTASGQGKHSSMESITAYLLGFSQHVGSNKSLSCVNMKLLNEYLIHASDQITNGTWTASTAKTKVVVVKAWVKWLEDQDYIEPIRGLRRFTIKTAATEVEPATIEQVKHAIAVADEMILPWILLGLNCGFTQVDIHNLNSDSIQDGRINHKRSKTSIHASTPTVSYKLWPATIKAMGQPQSEQHWFLTPTGQPLIEYVNRDNGTVQRRDRVNYNYKQRRKDLGLPQLKQYRKTSATLIAEQYDLDLAQLFLAHSPRTVAERHYVKVGMNRLDQALDWLQGQYGIQ